MVQGDDIGTTVAQDNHIMHIQFACRSVWSQERYLLQFFQALVHSQSTSQCSSFRITNSIPSKTVEKSTAELVQVAVRLNIGLVYTREYVSIAMAMITPEESMIPVWASMWTHQIVLVHIIAIANWHCHWTQVHKFCVSADSTLYEQLTDAGTASTTSAHTARNVTVYLLAPVVTVKETTQSPRKTISCS